MKRVGLLISLFCAPIIWSFDKTVTAGCSNETGYEKISDETMKNLLSIAQVMRDIERDPLKDFKGPTYWRDASLGLNTRFYSTYNDVCKMIDAYVKQTKHSKGKQVRCIGSIRNDQDKREQRSSVDINDVMRIIEFFQRAGKNPETLPKELRVWTGCGSLYRTNDTFETLYRRVLGYLDEWTKKHLTQKNWQD